MLSLYAGGAPELLENSDSLDRLIETGLAWVEAEFHDGRWMVSRVVAMPVPAPDTIIVGAPSAPRQRHFQVVASG